jgi:hypothetical protein
MNGFLKTATRYYSKSRFTKPVSMLFVVLCLLVACTKKHEDTSGTGGSGNCSGPAKSFAVDVNPIIQSSCSGSAFCHGSGSVAGPGPLLTHTQIFNARSSVRSAVSSGRMPPNGGLSATQKNSIMCWIDNGAPNN